MTKKFPSYLAVTLIILTALVPFFLWFPHSNFSNTRASLLSLGQITALIGFVLMSYNFILSTRLKIFDKLFFGINRMYIIHHLIGVIAFLLILIHPTFIISSYLLISLSAALNLVIPSITNTPVLLGVATLDAMILLMVLTLYIKLRYNSWKKTHQFMGITLILASVHILLVGSTVSQNIFLKTYLIFFMTIGIISYLYRTILGKITTRKRKFILTQIKNVTKNVIELSLKPYDNIPLKFYPGQFIFIELENDIQILRESHPFSIISSTNEAEIRLGVKTEGLFTQLLKVVKDNTIVNIEGPYGSFGAGFQKHGEQLWIAGGIGVTPFVSMVKSLPKNCDVLLYYSVKSKGDSAYNDVFERISRNNSNFKYYLWDSSVKGRLTINSIVNRHPDSLNRTIYICGPNAMTSDLKKQFILKGVSARNINTEEFSLG